MKTTLKIALSVLCFGLIGIMALAELNLENCIREASTMETDGEIQAVLHEHGFRIGINDEITPIEKLKALFR